MNVPEPGVLQVMAVMGVSQETAQTPWNGFVTARALESGIPTPRRGRVTTATLNVRAGPSTTATIVGKLAQGALVAAADEVAGCPGHAGDRIGGVAGLT